MYERFSDRACHVMQLANEEAQSHNHEYLGTEHVLLGLIKEGSGIAAIALNKLGLDLRKIRLEMEKFILPRPVRAGMSKLPQTPRVKIVIQYAIEEAHNLDHNYVGTEHLLLGLLSEQEGVAAQVLTSLGLKLEVVRDEVLSLLGFAKPNPEIIVQLPRGVCVPPPVEPAPKRWTREEYHSLEGMGFFRGQRVELIEGEIMVRSSQSWPHASTLARVGELLGHALGTGFWVRLQFPLNFGTSDPEPDVSVVPGTIADYHDHPTSAVLIVEVSDNSLYHDRTRKGSLYARAGIADNWIINLVDRQVEVCRDPRPDSTLHSVHGYGSVTVLVPPAVVSPLAAPQVSLAVADLLP
jgi:Uma2 family endonuclease